MACHSIQIAKQGPPGCAVSMTTSSFMENVQKTSGTEKISFILHQDTFKNMLHVSIINFFTNIRFFFPKQAAFNF